MTPPGEETVGSGVGATAEFVFVAEFVFAVLFEFAFVSSTVEGVATGVDDACGDGVGVEVVAVAL